MSSFAGSELLKQCLFSVHLWFLAQQVHRHCLMGLDRERTQSAAHNAPRCCKVSPTCCAARAVARGTQPLAATQICCSVIHESRPRSGRAGALRTRACLCMSGTWRVYKWPSQCQTCIVPMLRRGSPISSPHHLSSRTPSSSSTSRDSTPRLTLHSTSAFTSATDSLRPPTLLADAT